MLVGLTIRNIVLIDQLSLTFAPGLTALTGETGAGKSILLDALGLALGGRADSALVRHGADQSVVTALFEVPSGHPAAERLAEHGISLEDGLVLRRVLGADGRSRAFVNDQPVSVGLLRQIADELVEISGQFEAQGLLDPRRHRALLDAYGGLEVAAGRVAAAWEAWQRAEAEREAAAAEIARARLDQDYLRHSLAELDALAPEPGEEPRLAERRSVLMHREKLVDAIGSAMDAIAGEGLGQAQRALRRVLDKAGERLAPVIEAIEGAEDRLAEASSLLQRLAADLDQSPDELERTDERLFALRTAARKYGTDVESLAALRSELGLRLDVLDNQDSRLAALSSEAGAARGAYVAAAAQLTAARTTAARRLDRAVAAELAPLKLERARFETRLESLPEGGWGPAGADDAVFLVATNPGTPPGPLHRVASGGELARFTLALKVVLAQLGQVATLVFDEVDSGVGGAVADAVGERLARLGRNRQVLAVTHSPQVAARADHHWRVAKRDAITSVAELDAGDRREEIARMLSGARVTEQARAAAESLIAAGR